MSSTNKEDTWRIGCFLAALAIFGLIILVTLSVKGIIAFVSLAFLLGIFLIVVISAMLTGWYAVSIVKAREKKPRERQELEELRQKWAEERLERSLKSLEISGKVEEFSGKDFEGMVAKMFSKMGYSVAITKGSGDEGIDLYMKNKKGERVGVQCKKWKGIIGQSIIRDFYGSLMHAHLKKGFIVTTGRFSKAANAFTRGKSITLIDGNKLREILGEV